MLRTQNTLINMKEAMKWGVNQGVIATHGSRWLSGIEYYYVD